LHLEGESVKLLADQIGIKRNTVYNWVKAYKRNPETAFHNKTKRYASIIYLKKNPY